MGWFVLAPADPDYRLPPARQCLLIEQFGRPADLLDPDIQPAPRLGYLVGLGAQVSHPDGGNLLQFAAKLPGPTDSPPASGGVGDGRYQPVLGCIPVAERQRVGEREPRVQLGHAVRPVDPAGQLPQLADQRPSMAQQLLRAFRGLLAFLVAGHRDGPSLNLLKLLLLASAIG